MNDGGPAFPTSWVNEGDQNNTAPNGAVVPPGGETQLPGMSLRDYFAAEALRGVLVQWGALCRNVLSDKHEPFAELDEELAAIKAYRYADAMLAERNK